VIFISNRLESQKYENVLAIDNFQEPLKLSGKYAWCELIQHLLFLRKGTYPSDPNMGIELQKYDYNFIDTAISKLQDEINDQIRTYYPDMPFQSATLFSKPHPTRQEKILIIILQFNDSLGTDSVVIASTKTSSRIDFDISF